MYAFDLFTHLAAKMSLNLTVYAHDQLSKSLIENHLYEEQKLSGMQQQCNPSLKHWSEDKILNDLFNEIKRNSIKGFFKIFQNY